MSAPISPEDAYERTNVVESFKAESDNVVEKVRTLIHEGNVRRVIVKHDGRTIAEFPLTAGVVGAVLAPVVAAIGAIVALLKDCSIHVERVEGSPVQTQRDRAASDLEGDRRSPGA